MVNPTERFLLNHSLHAAGLDKRAPFGLGKAAVLAAIRQLGYVQIDTISVVARAHHHVLWSRVPGYRRTWLDELQQERKILEHWAHAAAYLPMEAFRFTLPSKKYFRDRKDGWQKCAPKLKKQILQIIGEEGPKMARDFEADRKRKSAGWWDWKPAKVALERLFFEGDLCCSHRKGFQKVYDLTERVVPSHLDTSEPTDDEYADYLIDRTLQRYAFATAPQIGYLRKGWGRKIKERLKQRLENGDLGRVTLQNEIYYQQPSISKSDPGPIAPIIKILSPFDPFLIQRKRIKTLFDFDYQLECYLPAEKRRYGYFVLPILCGQKFLGRMDAKADRKTGKFIIKNLHFENPQSKRLPIQKLEKEIARYAKFCSTTC